MRAPADRREQMMSSPPIKRYRIIGVRRDSGALQDYLANYESDERAMDAVQSLLDFSKWELWDGNRRIANSEMSDAAIPNIIY